MNHAYNSIQFNEAKVLGTLEVVKRRADVLAEIPEREKPLQSGISAPLDPQILRNT